MLQNNTNNTNSDMQHQQQTSNGMTMIPTNSNDNNNNADEPQNPMDGFFRDDGAFVQVMPDGLQFIYLPDGTMGYLLPDGTFQPMSQEEMTEMEAALEQQEEQEQQNQGTNIANNNVNVSGVSAAGSQQQQQQLQGFDQNTSSNNNNNNIPSPDPRFQQQPHQNGVHDNNNTSQQQHQTRPQLPPAPGIEPLFEADTTPNFGYWPNLIIEIFVSTFFKLYFCILLWNCAVILAFTGIDWMFGALSRVYHPPVDQDTDWQSCGWIGIFVVVSFFVATFLTMLLGLTKEAWRVDRLDTMFWGISFKFWTSLDFGCDSTNNTTNNANNNNQEHGTADRTTSSSGCCSDICNSPSCRNGKFCGSSCCCCCCCCCGDHDGNNSEDEMDVRPPYHLYGVLIFSLIILPFFTSIGVTVARGKTGIYFAALFSYIVHVVMLLILAVMYVWLYIRSLQAKWAAWKNHTTDPMDDEDESDPKIVLRRQAEEAEEMELQNAQNLIFNRDHNNQNGGDQSAVNQIAPGDRPFRRWYRSPALLLEFGLDQRSVQWMVFDFIFGFAGVLIVATILATQEIKPTLAAGWVVIVVIFVISLAVMIWASRRGKRTSIYSNALFILVFFILAMIGCGSSPFTGKFALFLVPFVLTQGMLLRKREYTLRQHEVEAIFGGSVEEIKPAYDNYIVNGGKSLIAALSYLFDVKKIFGVRHPQVKFADRQYRRERVSLYMDVRVLFHLWLIFWFMLCAISSFTNTLPWPSISKPQSAAPPNAPQSVLKANIDILARGERLQSASFPFCQYSLGNNATYSVYDLALMALLAESAGTAFDQDFKAFFADTNRSIAVRSNADVQAQFPAPNARQPSFLDFFEPSTKSHAIVVRAAANRGGTLLRNLDMMGDSASFLLASIFAPTLNSWPIETKREFVAGIADVKLVASNTNVTGDILSYLKEEVLTNAGHSAVIVGFGFNGAVAVIAGALSDTPVVTFNAPGTSLLVDKYRINDDAAQFARTHALHMKTKQSLVGLLGEPDDLGATHVLGCSDSVEFNCDSITGIARIIGTLCGDNVYQRVVWPNY